MLQRHFDRWIIFSACGQCQCSFNHYFFSGRSNPSNVSNDMLPKHLTM
jgi:hypothetical protein